MLPLKYLPVAPLGDLEVVKTGLFLTSSKVVADGLVVATDASGGMFTKDPRLRRVSWSVVVGAGSKRSVSGVGIHVWPHPPRNKRRAR